MSNLNNLETLFDFTNEDLQINRAGKLSERQQLQLKRSLLKSNIDKWFSYLTWVMFLVSLTLFIIFNLRYGDQLGSLVLVDIGIWLALVYILSKLIVKQGHIVLRQISNDQTNWFIRAFRNVNSKALLELETSVVEHTTGQLRFVSHGEHTYVMLNDLELTSNVAADKDKRLWPRQANKN